MRAEAIGIKVPLALWGIFGRPALPEPVPVLVRIKGDGVAILSLSLYMQHVCGFVDRTSLLPFFPGGADGFSSWCSNVRFPL